MMALAEHKIVTHEVHKRARDFLLKAQQADGAWSDFLLPAGFSNSWVTGYVGLALAQCVGDRAAQAAAERAWAFLHTTACDTGGWSYNPKVPGDADSTVWGLRLGAALGQSDCTLAQSGFEFLKTHMRPDGGLSTYASADPIRTYIGAPEFVPFDGWVQSHVCVTAAGANLLKMNAQVLEYLLENQGPNGAWPAYFWFDEEYSTGEAVQALAVFATQHSNDPRVARVQMQIEAGVAWLCGRVQKMVQTPGGFYPSFALSCALAGITTSCKTPAAQAALAKGAKTLREWQRETGGWGPSARLRVPLPDAMVPRDDITWRRWEGLPAGASSLQDVLKYTFTNFSPDHRGLFGAATALKALNAIDKALIQ